nr:MAG TPA: hypothetical protein [Caudoviricetes sp.]
MNCISHPQLGAMEKKFRNFWSNRDMTSIG